MTPEQSHVDPAQGGSLLAPYVPRLVVDWLTHAPEQTFRTVDGTGVFADISGFTALTELLARRGQVGAEEMGDILNAVFGELLAAAYAYGAGLVKWGGDAVLLLFDGAGHALRAARAAQEMQRVMARVGRVGTASGRVRLRMSIGLHSGDLDFLLVGEVFRELIVTGPGATAVARMETAADAGEIVVSAASAEILAAAGGVLGEQKGPGILLERAPAVAPLAAAALTTPSTDLRVALPAHLVDHLLAGEVASEHRVIAVCFVEFSGVDALREGEGLGAAASAVADVISACQVAAQAHDVTFLSSDIYPDGGKVILVAGAPRTTGDDAARVLSAARDALDGDHRLSLRAGCNVGRVFAGDYGPPSRRVYSVTGDCVNLAARLMGAAGPGQLVASTAAVAASRTRFSTESLPPFAVKGKSEPVEACLVGAVETASDQPAGAQLPLVGRVPELAALVSAWTAAQAGHGSATELVGEAGVGKSRLLSELAAVSGGQPWWLNGDIYATRTPYEPFQRLFATRLGIDHRLPEAADDLQALVAGLRPDLVPWLPLIGVVTGIDLPETAEVGALDPTVRKARLEEVTSALLAEILLEPTLLVFNDVHFMDEASTDLLDRLVRDVATRPWLIVATRRPTSLWSLPRVEHGAAIALAPLAPDDADTLLSAAMGDAALPAHRRAALVERSGGNPLYLTELASGLGSGVDADAVPDTVEGVIAARIDQLTPPQRTLLRTAAVLGMTFEANLLDVLVLRSGLDPEDASMASLSEFLGPSRDGLRFHHHLVRDTAYAGLPFTHRRRLHAMAADLLAQRADARTDQSELLSMHSFHGGRYQDAYRYARRAAESSRKRYANAEAIESYRRALAAARKLPRARHQELDLSLVWEALADVYEELGDVDAMGTALQEARRLLRDDPIARARLALLTSIQRRMGGDYTGSLRWATLGRRALEGISTKEAQSLRAKLAERYAQNKMNQGRLQEAIAWADTALVEATQAGDRRLQAASIEIRAASQSMLGLAVDIASLLDAVHIYETEHNDLGLARTHNVIGVIAVGQGDWLRGLRHYEASAEAYERMGRHLDVALQLANTAEVLIFQGQLSRASEQLTEALRLLHGSRALGEQAFARGQLGRVAMARGDLPEAQRLFMTARTTQDEIGEHYEVVVLDALIAEARLLAGDAAAALAQIDDTLERNRKIGAPLDYLARLRGQALIATGERDAGLAAVRASLDAARAEGSPYDEWRALVTLDEAGALRDDDRSALEALRPVLVERLGIALALVWPAGR
ncbi:unannotated protein [freshwater metagenome]|uniref:Unannotated protein n=1 Tax=freshwater metagenome TaxID=449393 RepID=A0A6J6NQ45_9ZZZZ